MIFRRHVLHSDRRVSGTAIGVLTPQFRKTQEHHDESPPSDQEDEKHEQPKKQPLKKKPVQQTKKQQQPTAQRADESDAGHGTLQLPADDSMQQLTLPPGKHDMVKDVAMQPLRGRKEMISQTIGDNSMKEIEEQREKDKDEKQSLRIKISLDLDVEVHLSARVKGDITIGLL